MLPVPRPTTRRDLSVNRPWYRAALAGLATLIATANVSAHSLSIQLNHTSFEPGRKATAFLSWGHSLPVDELIDGKDIGSFEVATPSGSRAPLKLDERSLQANELKLEEQGLYQFVAERKTQVYTVVSDGEGKHNYLRTTKREAKLVEGQKVLTSMRSRMYAKAIAIVGEAPEAAAPVQGHELEIVPLSKVSEFKSGEALRFRVLFQGKPLAGAHAAANLAAGSTTAPSSLEADAEGIFTWTPDEEGPYTLSVSHRTQPEESLRADFDNESYVATLTLGIAEDE